MIFLHNNLSINRVFIEGQLEFCSCNVEIFTSREDHGQVNLKMYCKLSHLAVIKLCKINLFFFFSTINQLTVRECSDKDEAIVHSAEQLSQHEVRNPDQTKPLFCSSLTVRTIERLGSMQTQHLFFSAVFLIKVLSVLLLFFPLILKGRFLSFC